MDWLSCLKNFLVEEASLYGTKMQRFSAQQATSPPKHPHAATPIPQLKCAGNFHNKGVSTGGSRRQMTPALVFTGRRIKWHPASLSSVNGMVMLSLPSCTAFLHTVDGWTDQIPGFSRPPGTWGGCRVRVEMSSGVAAALLLHGRAAARVTTMAAASAAVCPRGTGTFALAVCLLALL